MHFIWQMFDWFRPYTSIGVGNHTMVIVNAVPSLPTIDNKIIILLPACTIDTTDRNDII